MHAHAIVMLPSCLQVQAKILLRRHNAERVGVAHSASPALHADDGIALAENTELDCVHDAPLETAVDILLPWLRLEVWLCLREIEWVDAAVQVRVLRELASKGQRVPPALTREAVALRVTMMMGHTGRYFETRRAVVPLLRVSHGGPDVLRSDSPGGQDQNSSSVLLQTGTDSCHGACLRRWAGERSQFPQLVKSTDVWDGNFSQETCLVHHGDGLNGIVTLCGLARQHDTIGAVEDSVANVAHFSACRAWIVRHGLEHLCRANDGLASDVALCDHHLLCDEDLAGGDLDTEVTTSHHDAVSFPQNLIEVVHTLLVFDLGNDLDVLALLPEDLANGSDVAAAADEGGEDHVDTVLNTKSQVGLVLLRQRRKINVRLGQVNTLLRGDLAIVDTLALEGLLVYNLEDLKGQNTIVDVDGSARRNHLGDVLVVDKHVLVVTGGSVLLVGGNVQDGARLDGNIGVAHGVARADLGALGI